MRRTAHAIAIAVGAFCSPALGDEAPDASRGATLVVTLPADAVLELEDVQMNSSGPVRRFNIPSLESGRAYSYRIAATWTEGKNSRTIERTIAVRAGETIEVDLRPDAASADERTILDLTNRERTKAGLAPLTLSTTLCRAARAHSNNMATRNQLAHTIGQEQFTDRIAAAGYHAGEAGENIAMGTATPAECVAMWMRSPGHRGNILNPRFREFGVGMATARNGQTYYTQVFAVPAVGTRERAIEE